MITLVIRVPETVADLAQSLWARVSSDGALLEHGSGLDALPAGGYRQSWLLLPDSCVSYASITVPDAKLLKSAVALGYAVEDHIVDEADNVHITVIDSDPKAKQMRVAIVNKAWLAAMLSALAERDIAPDAAIPVSLCIDPPEKSWTILLDGQSGTLRRGPADLLPIDAARDGPPHLLQMALQDARNNADSPESLVVWSAARAGEATGIDPARWQESLGLPVRYLGNWNWHQVPKQTSVNLLQGAFRPRRKMSFDWLDSLRPVATATMAIGAVCFGAYALYGAKLLAERAVLNSRMQATFKDVFPAANVIHVPSGMRRELAQLRHAAGLQDSGDLVPLLAQFTTQANGLTPGAVTYLGYDKGRLDLKVMLPSEAVLVNAGDGLRSAGLAVSMAEVQPSGGGVQARLSIASDRGAP